MFEPRSLSSELVAVRDAHVPGAIVIDVDGGFETLPPSVAENLLAVVDGIDPLAYDESWLPADAPETLSRVAGGQFTIGAPGDGGVTWTRQTTPPSVFVKPRLEGSPEGFVDFLIAEALVELGLDVSEHFLGFFGEFYRELAAAVPLSSAGTYQLAAALHTAHVGLSTRPIFADWADTISRLYAEYHDAGARLEPRLGDLSQDVAIGRTDFADAAELACSAIKHRLEVPMPFDALDSEIYRQEGAVFALEWAKKTFEVLDGQ